MRHQVQISFVHSENPVADFQNRVVGEFDFFRIFRPVVQIEVVF